MEAESFTTASVDGAQIVCRVIGKGPPLVVLNGFGVASADWAHLSLIDSHLPTNSSC